MRIEHFALNVADPVGMARWYVEHLRMRIARGGNEPPYGHFLADGGEEASGNPSPSPGPSGHPLPSRERGCGGGVMIGRKSGDSLLISFAEWWPGAGI